MSVLRSEVRRTFTPPRDDMTLSKADGPGGMLFAQRVVFGFTTIEYRNRLTGRRSFEHILGDQTLPLDENDPNVPWRIDYRPAPDEETTP